jgi:hypothetical protein
MYMVSVLFIELFTNGHVSAIKKNNYSIFIAIVAIRNMHENGTDHPMLEDR